ncbi:uncharacterized protein LOC143564012 [Bidens hawaiensis]|uniref:uncharacterized protein LOC143564012 n=1 Tax=Bidens hawaiensis TaxID=980011 RepID=UPI00404A36C5
MTNVIPAVCIFYHNFNGETTLPAVFCQEIFEPGANMHPVVLYHKDKDWFVQVEFTNGRYVFQNGWAEFVEDNRLMFGDVLVFSPINENEWRFVYVRDHPVHDDMVVDAVVRYPTLKYLPLRDDQCVKLTTPRFGFTGMWEEMSKHCKLAVNDYLVFQRLQGTWTFRMHVFDSRGIERVNFNDDLVYTGPNLHPELGYVPMVIEIESDDQPDQDNLLEALDVGMEDVDEPVLDIIVPHVQEDNILEVIVRDTLMSTLKKKRKNEGSSSSQNKLSNSAQSQRLPLSTISNNKNYIDYQSTPIVTLPYQAINRIFDTLQNFSSSTQVSRLQCNKENVSPSTISNVYSSNVVNSGRINKFNVQEGSNASCVVDDIPESSTTFRRRLRKRTPIVPIPMTDLNEHATTINYHNVVDVYKGISSEYLDHGNQSVMCPSCNALLWKAEVNRPSSASEEGAFSLCCYNDKVELPDVRQPDDTYLDLFYGESSMSKYFLKNIRRFNSMFSFTSMGGKIDHSINRGNAPYTFRLSGENYHCLGSLLPLEGCKPQFSQLYIYDTENEVSNRQGVFGDNNSMDDELEMYIINYLKTMLDSNNHLVQAYQMVRDCFEENPQLDLKLCIIGTRQHDARQYNLPSSSEVAALIVGDIGHAVDNRDIIVTKQSSSLKRIIELNPSYTPLQYPLFHPFGQDGYQVNILHKNVFSSSTAARTKLFTRSSFKKGGYRMLIFAYLCIQGPDRATISLVQNNNADNPDPNLDEIKAFYDCRYVSACEATWRIFSFDVHYRIPSVMRLAFHLPGEQQVIYGANEDIEDILNKTTNASSMFTGLILNEQQLKNLAVLETEIFLISNNSSLRKYQQMPFPDMETISRATNPLMVEELSYDTETMNNEFNNLFDSLTDEQRGVYNEIMSALIGKKGGVYFVYGYGGTGKTYLWKTLSASIRLKGEVVLNVKGNTDVYELLKKTSLIIWDEAPMIHKHAFEALDRTLNDVMHGDSCNSSEAVFRVLKLTKNMRLIVGCRSSDVENIREFADWLLDIRQGNVGGPNDGQMLHQDRALLAPLNEVVQEINERMLAIFPGEEVEYLSSDSLAECEDVSEDFDPQLYSPDLLNVLKMSGMPNHRLVLKVGVPIKLLRNINHKKGLCNGTRLQVVSLGRRVIDAKVVSGTNIGYRTLISRVTLTPTDKKLPFRLKRRQFPISVCFAMTINKSQGQSLSRVGLYLKDPVFSHGQVYVALSRVKSRYGIKLVILDKESKLTNKTTNVVYKEIFGNVE